MAKEANHFVSLVSLFDNRRDCLRQQVADDSRVSAAARTLQDFVDSLFVDFLQQQESSPPNAKLVGLFRETTKRALELLTSADHALLLQELPPTQAVHEAIAEADIGRRSLWWLPLTRIGIIALIACWIFLMFHAGTEEIFIMIALIALVVLEVVGAIHARFRRATAVQKRAPTKASMPSIHATAQVNVDKALVKLRDLLLYVDRILERAEQEWPANTTENEIPDSILDYLHELASAASTNDSKFALERSQHMAGILVPFDILIETEFDANQKTNRFQVIKAPPGENIKMPTLIKPAFVRDAHTLRRGEVWIPRE